ncbi:DUF732 domain-containing protein [Streptomyces sp. NPDC047315]|uniref:DUF732 domain-containing protein n=1 Tax=Streptomyces sp. NPDC047315 TaxID=3155142 RepID=UPI00340EECFD
MERKTWFVVGGAVLALGAVLSLFEDDDKKTDDKPTAKSSAVASSEPGKSAAEPSAPVAGSGVPTPDAQQRAALIQALAAVDAGLATKEERAVSRARSVCLDVKEGKDAATVQSNAKQRFEGGTVPSLNDDQAGRIVSAVKSSFCV